jgi:hypothetical protein
MSYNNGPTIVRDGLVLYYDPASPKSYVSGSTTIYDLSPTGTTASLVNGVGYATSSQGVFNFDGVNDYISFARPSSIVTSGSLSICMYAKWDLPTGSLPIMVLMENSHSASPVQGFVLQDRPDINKRLSFSVRPTASLGATSSFRVSTDNWYNITATHDGTVSRLYINGVLDGFLTESNGISTVQPTINIGRWQNAATGSRFFTGSIGQVLMYNRALSATEVKQNYDATKGRYPGVNPYIINEDFEGSSFTDWNLVNMTVDGSSPLIGMKSLRQTTYLNRISRSFDPQDEVWMFYVYRLDLPSAETYIRLPHFRNPSNGIVASLGMWGVSNTRVEGGGKNLFPALFTPYNQTAYVWIRYVAGTGANSIAEFYVSSTPQRPATASYSWTDSTSTTPASNIYFTTDGSVLNTRFDYFRVSKTEIGSYPL